MIRLTAVYYFRDEDCLEMFSGGEQETREIIRDNEGTPGCSDPITQPSTVPNPLSVGVTVPSAAVLRWPPNTVMACLSASGKPARPEA